MPEKRELCEWCVMRKNRLLQCQSRATQYIDVEGERLHLCAMHTAVISRLLARKDKLQKYYDRVTKEIHDEQQRILDAYEQLRRKQNQGGFND